MRTHGENIRKTRELRRKRAEGSRIKRGLQEENYKDRGKREIQGGQGEYKENCLSTSRTRKTRTTKAIQTRQGKQGNRWRTGG